MSRFLDKKLSSLESYLPGEQPEGRRVVKLNTNENPFAPSPAVVDAITKEEVQKLSLYPDPVARELSESIAAYYGIRREQILTGNGSDELLAFSFHGLCPNGAAFSDLTYGFYPVYCQMFGVKERIVKLREDFRLAIEDYMDLKETIFIANPNAPTGLNVEVEAIEKLLKRDPDRLVIIDEAYVDFGGTSCIPLIDRYDNLLVIQTFSKSRQLAGMRLAFAAGSEELITALAKMKFSFNPYSVNRLALLAGKAAIEDEAYFLKTTRAVIETREWMKRELEGYGCEVLPSKANFLFVRPPVPAQDVFMRCKEEDVFVRYFPGERTGEWLRISVGTREDAQRLLEVLDKIFEEGSHA
jgi:histidinol-phosphate aminotransferase